MNIINILVVIVSTSVVSSYIDQWLGIKLPTGYKGIIHRIDPYLHSCSLCKMSGCRREREWDHACARDENGFYECKKNKTFFCVSNHTKTKMERTKSFQGCVCPICGYTLSDETIDFIMNREVAHGTWD